MSFLSMGTESLLSCDTKEGGKSKGKGRKVSITVAQNRMQWNHKMRISLWTLNKVLPVFCQDQANLNWAKFFKKFSVSKTSLKNNEMHLPLDYL